MTENNIIKKALSNLDAKGLFFAALIFASGYFIAVGNVIDTRNSAAHILPSPACSSDSPVKYGDRIYFKDSIDWEHSPIVLQDYRLLIFTSAKVGCTVFKMLARRMSGYEDYTTIKKDNKNVAHNPHKNGLTFLYDLDIATANEVMTSPNWTRAIFVRDPKARFLSAYLDKVERSHHKMYSKCCLHRYNCNIPVRPSLKSFFQVARKCKNTHWVPQSQKMEAKYWKCINFVGHIENAQEDAERLLRKVGMGVWEKFGKDGWGVEGDGPIFSTNNKKSPGTHHAKNAAEKLRKYYTPELEELVEEFYEDDYNNPVLQLEKTKIFV